MSNVQLIALAHDTHSTIAPDGSVHLSRAQNAIEAAPMRAFLVLTAFYLAAVVCLSHFKLLWLDELITLHIARLPSVAAIWHALAQGADPNPPVTYLLVHLCRNLFGEGELTLRLPAIFGYWLGLLSLFLFLLRRIPAIWALSGTVILMSMGSFDYSYESRSYGILFGLTMLAFLLWTRSRDPLYLPRSRAFYLAGMTLTLAACVSTNYFAVLAFLPIAAGELARTLSRFKVVKLSKAIDFKVWLCLVLAATPLLVYRPLIAHSIAQFAPYAWNKVSLDQVYDSYTEMVEVALVPILILFAVAALACLARYLFAGVRSVSRYRLGPSWLSASILAPRPELPLPAHESVGVLCFMAYPFLGYAVASLRGGMLSGRFVIPVCFGFAIAAAVVAFTLFGKRKNAGLYLLCFATAWFSCREIYVGCWYFQQKKSFSSVVDSLPVALRAVPPQAPIVIPDPLFALAFQQYAPAPLARRAVFPVDFPALRRYRHDDSPEQNLWAGRNSLYTLPIVTVADFQRSAGEYLIVASAGNWFLHDLADHRYGVTRLPIDTHAGAIGGFTPLAHGTPTFYVAAGDQGPCRDSQHEPIEFRAEDNLPDARPSAAAGADQRVP